MEEFWKPTKEQVAGAKGKSIPDVIAPDLKVIFCGINPGLYTAAIGHHFGRPGNRFWPALHAGGFTPTQFSPFEEQQLIPLGYGITNVVNRATAQASELSNEELVEGGKELVKKVLKYRPKILAVLGIVAYRAAFDRKSARLGKQKENIGQSQLWVLPNPSGLNAHFQIKELGKIFKEVRNASSENS
jgi:TDG/mug DNA glycosylase family protein